MTREEALAAFGLTASAHPSIVEAAIQTTQERIRNRVTASDGALREKYAEELSALEAAAGVLRQHSGESELPSLAPASTTDTVKSGVSPVSGERKDSARASGLLNEAGSSSRPNLLLGATGFIALLVATLFALDGQSFFQHRADIRLNWNAAEEGRYVANTDCSHSESEDLSDDENVLFANCNAQEQPSLQISACSALLKKHPNSSVYYGNRAQAYFAENRVECAVRDGERAVENSVDDWNKAFNGYRLATYQAQALEQQGKYDGAIQKFNDAVASHSEYQKTAENPDVKSGWILNHRCWLRVTWGRELEQAEQDCKDAVELFPFASTYDSLAHLALKQGRFEEAFEAYQHAADLEREEHKTDQQLGDDTLASILFGRGIAALKLNRNDAAEIDIGAAKILNPSIEKKYADNGVSIVRVLRWDRVIALGALFLFGAAAFVVAVRQRLSIGAQG